MSSERLPPNMMRRRGILYTRMRIRGRDVWRSLRTTSVKEATRRQLALGSKLIDEHHYGLADRRMTLGDWWLHYQEGFLSHLTPRRQLRVRTIVGRAVEALGAHRWLHEIGEVHAVKYLAARRKAGLQDGTVWQERVTLASVFGAAQRSGYVGANVWRVKVGKPSKPRIRLVTPAHEGAVSQHRHAWLRRWFEFVLETGLRLAESTQLQSDDVSERDIRVLGKGGHWRYVPLTARARTVLCEQLAEGGPWRHPHSTIEGLLRDISAGAALSRISPHDLRHTFATRKALAGMPIYQLAAMLGHQSISTTEKYYVHVKREDVRCALLGVTDLSPNGSKPE